MLYGLAKIPNVHLLIYLFMSLFVIPSHSITSNILPNLWQWRLEKPPLLLKNNIS